MKNIKKIIALVLAILSVMAIAIPAFAADAPIYLDVAPGSNPRTVGIVFPSGTARFTCTCTRAGSGDTVRVFLDTYSIKRGDWVQRASFNFNATSASSHSFTYYLGTTESMARIRTYGYNENVGTATVKVEYIK